ncbi:MAG: ADP-ribosylation factor-like protein, partial [Planctomycetota bacterium]
MVQINFAQKSVTVKIVYYGPGMSGKTTNLEVVHQRAPESNKGDLTSISTDGDRTLFFDFMPLDLGTVAGMRTQFQIYTVPGQVYYNSTRKLVLQGVDGVIFIADSSASMMEENLESLGNLAENLAEYGKDIAEIPMVIQYNKRDLPDALPVEELEKQLNPHGVPSFEAVANSGQGVFPTLKSLAASVLDSIHEQTGSSSPSAAPAPAAPAAPAAPVAAAPPAPAP